MFGLPKFFKARGEVILNDFVVGSNEEFDVINQLKRDDVEINLAMRENTAQIIEEESTIERERILKELGRKTGDGLSLGDVVLFWKKSFDVSNEYPKKEIDNSLYSKFNEYGGAYSKRVVKFFHIKCDKIDSNEYTPGEAIYAEEIYKNEITNEESSVKRIEISYASVGNKPRHFSDTCYFLDVKKL